MKQSWLTEQKTQDVHLDRFQKIKNGCFFLRLFVNPLVLRWLCACISINKIQCDFYRHINSTETHCTLENQQICLFIKFIASRKQKPHNQKGLHHMTYSHTHIHIDLLTTVSLWYSTADISTAALLHHKQHTGPIRFKR